jgi:hypothetical protein
LTARCSGSGPRSPNIQRNSGCRIEAFRDNYRVRSGFLNNDGFAGLVMADGFAVFEQRSWGCARF